LRKGRDEKREDQDVSEQRNIDDLMPDNELMKVESECEIPFRKQGGGAAQEKQRRVEKISALGVSEKEKE
jgi:hypothetical protein